MECDNCQGNGVVDRPNGSDQYAVLARSQGDQLCPRCHGTNAICCNACNGSGLCWIDGWLFLIFN